MAFTSKFSTTLAVLSVALMAFSTSGFAQKVEIDDLKISIEIQKTPRFSQNGPKEKRDTQKQWVEVEVAFKADQKGGNRKEEFIDELEFKYFITMTPKDPSARKVYTLTVTHVNIPKGDPIASVAYMSPTAVAKIIGKNKVPSKATVDVAVEIRYKGQLVGGDATKSPSKKWWNSMSQEAGMVLDKTKTPFAPLWWDRYAEVKGN